MVLLLPPPLSLIVWSDNSFLNQASSCSEWEQEEFLLSPIGILATGSAHSRPSSTLDPQPPITLSRNFWKHITIRKTKKGFKKILMNFFKNLKLLLRRPGGGGGGGGWIGNLIFCELGAHTKFQNPKTTPFWEKSYSLVPQDYIPVPHAYILGPRGYIPLFQFRVVIFRFCAVIFQFRVVIFRFRVVILRFCVFIFRFCVVIFLFCVVIFRKIWCLLCCRMHFAWTKTCGTSIWTNYCGNDV
jgi:hypothetical protein